MNKKLLIFGLFVFIALIAISAVSAEQRIDLDVSYESSSAISNCEVPITDAEHKVLKEGKTITKKMNVAKEVKTYGKTKKITHKEYIMNKKYMKKEFKKAVKGKSCNDKWNNKLEGCKLLKISFKNFVHKDRYGAYKAFKIIVKYKPAVYKIVTKTTKATIKLDDDDYATIMYVNPFNHKKTYEYGELVYY